MATQNIHSFVRLKPSSDQSYIQLTSNNTVYLPKTNQCFQFQYAFDDQHTNQQIFERTTVDIIRSAIKGFNSCIFAYGQTCSGKTFTMRGNDNSPGIIPLTISEIFRIANDPVQKLFIQLRVSYLEIYNENINDLLNEKNTNLEIREDCSKNLMIMNLTETKCLNLEQANYCFALGQTTRKYASTLTNHNSSRSHTIFKIIIDVIPKDRIHFKTTATINLIDLAGSEGVSKTKAQGHIKKEGENINKSLLALSNVIRGLSQKSFYVNFRDSKLTRILQNSLNGNSKTVVICTINPSSSNISESISTLKFGVSAGQVKLTAKINNISQNKGIDSTGQKSNINPLFHEQSSILNEKLAYIQNILKQKEQLQRQSAQKDGIIIELRRQVGNLKSDCKKYKQKIKNFDAEIQLLKKMLKQREQEIDQTTQCNSKISKILQQKKFKQSKDNQKTLDKLIEANTTLIVTNSKLEANQKMLIKKIQALQLKLKNQINTENLQLIQQQNHKKSISVKTIQSWQDIQIDPIKLQRTLQLHIKISQKNRQIHFLKKQNNDLLTRIAFLQKKILQIQEQKNMPINYSAASSAQKFNGKKQLITDVEQRQYRSLIRRVNILKKQMSHKKRKQQKYLNMLKHANQKILQLQTSLLQKSKQENDNI